MENLPMVRDVKMQNKTNWRLFLSFLLSMERRIRSAAGEAELRNYEANSYLDEIAGLDRTDSMVKYVFFIAGIVSAFASSLSILKFGLNVRDSGWLGVVLATFSVLSILRFLASARIDKAKRIIARDNALKLIDQVHIGDRVLPKLQELSLPDNYVASGYQLHQLQDGIGIWSNAVSEALVVANGRTETRIVIGKEAFSGGELRKQVGCKIAYERLIAGRPFENETKIRLLSDVLLHDGKLPPLLKLQETDYLANLATNDLAFRTVSIPQAQETAMQGSVMKKIYNGESYFLSDDRCFLGFPNSKCSSQLGISLLAFTDDGYLVRVLQQPASMHSPGLVAPSGSGSLDWADLGEADSGDIEFWTWAASQNRELLEELGLDRRNTAHEAKGREFIGNLKIRSLPIGFGCYLHRSAKPEIICLTRMNTSLADIAENCRYTLTEDRYSRIFGQQDTARLERFEAGQLASFLEARLAEPANSVPLEMGYMMLRHLCETQPARIEAFLRWHCQ